MRRVREVADAWFDSGSMPVAQWHYPFENREVFAEQFPADYICEAIDQTRGWFYTLHAVSTLLFDSVAFKNVICLGHIVAEDGGKMSKSRGNMVNPWSIMDLHGADATRWYMYTASPAGNTRRFSANLVKEVVGRFLLTLWNSYSFFVTYANLNDFDPATPPVPLDERSVLDRWVLAKLHNLIAEVTHALETYDVTGATRPIQDFVDELSNWYVRLSRQRFWNVEPGERGAQLSLAAHQTMYEVLVTLAHLLAPFAPFMADEVYCNLVGGGRCSSSTTGILSGAAGSILSGATGGSAVEGRSAEGGRLPLSVHLSRWPEPNPLHADPQLLSDMTLAQKVVGLGRAARESASLKLRQPLAEAFVGVPSKSEADAVLRLADEVVKEELNVKALHPVTAGSELVDVQIHPLPKQLGQRYGRRFPAIKAALQELDPLAVAHMVEAGKPVDVSVEGETIAVLPDEVQVRKQPKPGLAVAEDAGYLVAVTTELNDMLRWEGYAREVVRNIQELRKKSGFEISDRIATTVKSGPALEPVWREFGAEIARETLSIRFDRAAPGDGAFTATLTLDGQEVVVGVRRA
jgi:isoleucyl-tRNA synthetase